MRSPFYLFVRMDLAAQRLASRPRAERVGKSPSGDTRWWVGRGTPSKRETLKATKKLKKSSAYSKSGARWVGRFLLLRINQRIDVHNLEIHHFVHNSTIPITTLQPTGAVTYSFQLPGTGIIPASSGKNFMMMTESFRDM